MNRAILELDAANKCWRCSECGLVYDCIGRPIFGNESWTIKPRSNSWLENRPQNKYCANCGMRFMDRKERERND